VHYRSISQSRSFGFGIHPVNYRKEFLSLAIYVWKNRVPLQITPYEPTVFTSVPYHAKIGQIGQRKRKNNLKALKQENAICPVCCEVKLSLCCISYHASKTYGGVEV
jgi:hypothetical protein